MYIRIYPSRNTTITKSNNGSLQEVNGLINTGKNTIFELQDGNSYSTILMSFDISSIKPLLEEYPFTCNLKLFDAGTIFEPSITLKTIDLVYFEEEFIEGDGWFYFGEKTLTQAANWQERVTGVPWIPAQPNTFSQGLFPAYQLNDANEDIVINNIQNFINTAINNNVNTPNFGIRISNNTPDNQTYTKFIHSRHTRTIFKPYLEFYIDNNILDNRHNCVATQNSNFYLINETGSNFVGSVSVDILDVDNNIIASPIVNNPSPGIYYVSFNPNISYADNIIFDSWKIDGKEIIRNLIQVKSPNQISSNKLDNLFFYPTTTYLYPIIRKGDIISCELISEIRGKGKVLLSNYEFKVVSTSLFEMQPWQPINIYNNRLFFTINTSFYFPDLEYEILVRLNQGVKGIKTSNMTYKFKLVEDTASHLRDKAASPYNNRDYLFFNKR
jgi:hypothetical protein